MPGEQNLKKMKRIVRRTARQRRNAAKTRYQSMVMDARRKLKLRRAKQQKWYEGEHKI